MSPRRSQTPFELAPAWKQVTPELKAELIDFWQSNGAIGNRALSEQRAPEVVCVGRDADGGLCAVSTAVLCVLPRLRQPMYYFRLFFAKSVRGRGQVIPVFNRSREVLQAYNRTLPAPESIGVLVELESRFLSSFYKKAYEPEADSTFIGYSPRGLQLRVSYFSDIVLPPPLELQEPQGVSPR